MKRLSLSDAILNVPHPPSLRRMLTAQFCSVLFGFPAAIFIMIPLGLALTHMRQYGVNPGLVNTLHTAMMYFVQAAALALVQCLILKRAVPHPQGWLVASGLLGVVLMPFLFPLTARLSMLVGGQMLGAHMTSLPCLVICALIGSLFGGLLALVQSFWLGGGARRWVAVSSSFWAILWAVLYPLVFGTLY